MSVCKLREKEAGETQLAGVFQKFAAVDHGKTFY
jgi:hypothetical protein